MVIGYRVPGGFRTRSDPSFDWRFGCPGSDLSAGPRSPPGTHRSGERDLIGACLLGSSLSCPPPRHVRSPPGYESDKGMTVTTMTEPTTRVTAGADTHRDQHVVAALDERGGQLGVRSFPTTPAGYRHALAWLRGFGTVERAGIEGTGSYGAGLARYLRAEDVAVVEVNRPNRQLRRSHGKSDPVDAVAAARAAQSGEASGEAKPRTGAVEAIRALRVARRSAGRGRTTALSQMRALLVSGPDDLRETLRGSTVSKLVTTAARFRPADPTTAAGATKFALRELARQVQSLEAECERLDAVLEPLVAATAPDLVASFGVGTDTPGALLVSARRQPAAPAQRGCVRPSLRRRPDRRLLGADHPQATQPRWGPNR